MMVMPLGPDFARSLGIPNSHLGFIGGSYTAAASISGLVGALFLDRFDRRKALAVAMFGLVCGTAAGGFATGLASLSAARVVAGAFGGPATSLSLSIIADGIPPERRGRALGAVAGAFSIASVLGVPAGLELARVGGWRLPFFAVAALGLLVATAALLAMPPMRAHLDRPRSSVPQASPLEIVRRREVQASLASTAIVMVTAFAIIPNLSAYLQYNLGYPREHLGLLYLVGGAVSFVTMRLVGSFVDRYGSAPVAAAGTVLFIGVLTTGFLGEHTPVPVMLLFVAFMISGSMRNVPVNTQATKVPQADERARFMSTQSAVQHFAAASGAFLGAQMLTERPDHALAGMPSVALMSAVIALPLPLLLAMVAARLKRRDELWPVPTPELVRGSDGGG
ncbi:MAG: MFS transporter [Deltaproteobacteria bacterium]|nr:MFS transporter [Deltaproteobacteria bacterium]